MRLPTLRTQGEFRRVYSQGRKARSRFFTVYLLPDPGCEFKYGLTVSRRVGTHVSINKVRRRLRDIVRRWVSDSPPAVSMVIVARKPIVCADFQDIKREFTRLVERLLK